MPVALQNHHKATAAESASGAVSLPRAYTTRWHRDHSGGTRRDEAINLKQQLLSPREEQAIVDFVLRAHRNGFPARVKDLHLYTAVSVSGDVLHNVNVEIRPRKHRRVPAKDWPQAFCKRHPESKVARLRALDWRRHEENINVTL